jgi:hypothetical protein
MNFIVYVVLSFIYLGLSMTIGFWAEKRNRSYWVWLLISLFVTPLISTLILACKGKKMIRSVPNE